MGKGTGMSCRCTAVSHGVSQGLAVWDSARSKEADGARRSTAEETLLQNISSSVLE